jgi:hypothetical protein
MWRWPGRENIYAITLFFSVPLIQLNCIKLHKYISYIDNTNAQKNRSKWNWHFYIFLIGNVPHNRSHPSYPRPMYSWGVKPCTVDKYRCFGESTCLSNSRPPTVQVEVDRSHIQTVIINQTTRRHIPGNSIYIVIIARNRICAKFLRDPASQSLGTNQFVLRCFR